MVVFDSEDGAQALAAVAKGAPSGAVTSGTIEVGEVFGARVASLTLQGEGYRCSDAAQAPGDEGHVVAADGWCGPRGVILLTTQGLPHALGGGLAGACRLVAFQLWLRLRRRDG